MASPKETAGLTLPEDAVNRCMQGREEMPVREVLAALDCLARRAAVKWPFDQFLDQDKEQEFQKEARRQILHASLNGIRRALLDSSV